VTYWGPFVGDPDILDANVTLTNVTGEVPLEYTERWVKKSVNIGNFTHPKIIIYEQKETKLVESFELKSIKACKATKSSTNDNHIDPQWLKYSKLTSFELTFDRDITTTS